MHESDSGLIPAITVLGGGERGKQRTTRQSRVSTSGKQMLPTHAIAVESTNCAVLSHRLAFVY